MSFHTAEFSLKNDAPCEVHFEYSEYEPACLEEGRFQLETPASINIMEIWFDGFEWSQQLIPPEIEHIRKQAMSYMEAVQIAALENTDE